MVIKNFDNHLSFLMEYISWKKKHDFQRYVCGLRSIRASFVLCCFEDYKDVDLNIQAKERFFAVTYRLAVQNL